MVDPEDEREDDTARWITDPPELRAMRKAAEEKLAALHERLRTTPPSAETKQQRVLPPPEDGPPSGATSVEDEGFVHIYRLQEVLEIFTQFMGPAAKKVLDAELRNIGVTPRTLPASRMRELVKRLAGRLDSNPKRHRFFAAVARVPGAFG
jgi:hypothetical protein